jgi:lipopolysaccharide/colanic/teichoic acid biosynthesis glycosyltransferase
MDQLAIARSLRWGNAGHRLAKRSLDVGVAAAGLFVLLPVMGVTALAIRLSSRGSVLLRQVRVGQDGEHFEMLKFRTMYQGSDAAVHEAYYRQLVAGETPSSDGTFKLTHDPRVTPIGRFLRRLSVDEIPQLYNVLKGDMSLVGPRPPLPYEVALYDARALQRLSAPPGMSGLWQVSGRNKLNFDQMIDLDLAYIARWSFWLDLGILARTVPAVVAARTA